MKASLKDSACQLSPENRLHIIERSGVAALEEAQPSMKKRESVKLKERVKNRARVEGLLSESLLLYLQPSV